MMATTVTTEVTSSNIRISVVKALQEIAKRQLSGRLTIREPKASSVIWRVYVGNGLLHFATSMVGQQERLFYLLQRYNPKLEFSHSTKFELDYQHLCYYWQSGQLSLQQLRQLLFSLTQEAMLHLLALPQAELGFEKTSVGLDPLILSVSFKDTVTAIQDSIHKLVQLQPEVISPFQRFFIKDVKLFSRAIQINSKEAELTEVLSKLLPQNPCLYELAYQSKRDTLELATFLLPLIRAGVIGVNPYYNDRNEERPIVACIDDSKTVQRNVKLILEASGYRVLELIEPARALTTLVRQKPILVLMDISMPEVDGYELCRMLRQTTMLREIPIVMLTGRDGLIDRLRSKMVGATDYITKPFNPQQLVDTVRKLTNRTHLKGIK